MVRRFEASNLGGPRLVAVTRGSSLDGLRLTAAEADTACLLQTTLHKKANTLLRSDGGRQTVITTAPHSQKTIYALTVLCVL